MPKVGAKPAVDKKTTRPPKGKPVVYPKVKVVSHIGEHAITQEKAKQLLGWVEVTTGVLSMLKDHHGRRIACTNNRLNRPFYTSNCRPLVQEHLRRRWQFNGEPIIVGKYGNILNGQHSLIALILAAQEWKAQGGKWKDYWQTEPTMEKLIVFGVSEEDAVVNTLDTCKPRSLADVVFRSELLQDKSAKDRKALATRFSHAIRIVWDRLGMSQAYSLSRTLTESVDFAYQHPTLLECTCFLYDETGKDSLLNKCLSPGYLSGLMYLMACTKSTSEEYYASSQPSEELLDLTLHDKASEFMVLLGSGELKPVVTAIARLDGGGLPAERIGTIIKAWNLWSTGSKLTPAALRLDYEEDEDGFSVLVESPIIGGIDIGKDAEA